MDELHTEQPAPIATTATTLSPPPQTSWATTAIHLAVITALSLSVFLFQLGRTDWQDDMESVGAQIVQELLAGHSWVLPLRNGIHIPYKPPLFYWFGALGAVARGSDGNQILDARLPSALLGTLGVLIVYAFTRRVADARTALWASLILITTPQFIIEARNPRVDMSLCVFLAAALFLGHLIFEGKAGRGAALLAGLCLGLATLAKGPLALALMVMVSVAAALVLRPLRNWSLLLRPQVLLLAAGIPALWYIAAIIVGGMPFVRLQLLAENVGRLTGEQGMLPWTWYIGPLLASGLPWILALPATLNGESSLSPRTRRYLWIWFALLFVFFSIVPGKRRVYILVVRPALAVLLAGWLAPFLGRARDLLPAARLPRVVHIIIGVMVLLLIVAAGLLSVGAGGFGSIDTRWSYWWREYLAHNRLLVIALALGIGAGIELMALWVRQRRYEWAAFAFTATLALGLGVGIAAGGVVRGNGASFKPFAERVTTTAGSATVSFFDANDQIASGLLFYLKRHLPVLSASTEKPCEPPQSGLYLVSASAWDEQPCYHDARWQMLERGGPVMQPQRHLVLARFGDTPS